MEHLHRYMLARHLCRGRDVLDIASGEGYGAALLGQVASTVIGVEVAEDAVAHAIANYARANLRFRRGDARKSRWMTRPWMSSYLLKQSSTLTSTRRFSPRCDEYCVRAAK